MIKHLTEIMILVENGAEAPESHANEVTFVLEHRSMASFDFCSSSNTFVLYLLIAQQDATYLVYYISVGSSTCFGC